MGDLDVVARLSKWPEADFAYRSLDELQTWREELRTAKNDAFQVMERISGSADGRQLTKPQQNDYAAADARLRDAATLQDCVDDAIRRKLVDRDEVMLATGDADSVVAASMTRDHYAAGLPLTREQTVAGFVRALGQVREGHERLSLRKYLRGMVIGDWSGAGDERRAMSEGVLAGGGYLLPSPLSASIIDLARAQTRVLQAGAQLVPMQNKTLDIARWEGDPSMAWHSENAGIAASDAVLGRVRLEARALAGRVVLSRELLEDADGIDTAVRAAFAAQLALIVDQAALYGSGVDPEPRGVKNTSGITVQTSGTNGAQVTSWAPLVASVGALADVNETATGIIYSSRTARTFEGGLFDSTGQPLQPPPYVAGVPRYATTQIPNNLTAGTSGDTSDVFTADWSKLAIGVRTTLELVPLKERYADTGQIGLLAWWRGDIAVLRPAAFHVRTGVRA